jgi:AcrR family transcriptional regulator
VRQRRRTRASIVAATAELLRTGRTPTINDIADAADVSRRTIYQYFPTVEQLLLDATVGLLSEAMIDDAIDAADGGANASARVEAMIRALSALSSETLQLGRSLIRLTVDSDATEEGPKRGYRRVQWIERALEPIRHELDAAAFEQLVSALSMVVGWEALIVLADVRGLNAAQQVETSVWASNAIIHAALSDSGPRPRRGAT